MAGLLKILRVVIAAGVAIYLGYVLVTGKGDFVTACALSASGLLACSWGITKIEGRLKNGIHKRG